MFTILFALAAVAADPAAKPAPVATAEAPAAPVSAPPTARRYCIRDDLTGSRVTRRVCRTRAEWDRAGVKLD